ncbi:hypothetical protein D3C84_801550 [compost metagenome]
MSVQTSSKAPSARSGSGSSATSASLEKAGSRTRLAMLGSLKTASLERFSVANTRLEQMYVTRNGRGSCQSSNKDAMTPLATIVLPSPTSSATKIRWLWLGSLNKEVIRCTVACWKSLSPLSVDLNSRHARSRVVMLVFTLFPSLEMLCSYATAG